jgi:hypothetical protein
MCDIDDLRRSGTGRRGDDRPGHAATSENRELDTAIQHVVVGSTFFVLGQRAKCAAPLGRDDTA